MIFKPTELFDSHAHLNFTGFDSKIEDIMRNCYTQGVKAIYDMSTDLSNIEKSLGLSKRFPIIKSFVGIDPEIFIPGSEFFEDLEKDDVWFESIMEKLSTIIENNTDLIAGIGETGMDAYWLTQHKVDSEISRKSLKLQEKLFRLHLELAVKFKLPLSIHTRGAEIKCLNIMKNYNAVGVFHSFTGDYETAKKVLDQGLGLGINGIITFKNADELRRMYKKLIGSISENISPEFFYKKGFYFETDAPFLSPERGKQNESANIKVIYEKFIEFLK